MTTRKNNGTKHTNQKKKETSRKTTKSQAQKTENAKSRGVVFMLFGLIFALWFLVAFLGNMVGSELRFTNKLLQILTFFCNFGVALVLVYYGFSLFVQKTMRFSGWQLVGWLCLFFSVAGMLHLPQCGTGFSVQGFWQAFHTACFGFGGGLCGFLPAYLVHFIPSVRIQYVLFGAFSILGILLGTNMKVVDWVAGVFERDPEKIAERRAKRDARAVRRADKKAERVARAKAARPEAAQKEPNRKESAAGLQPLADEMAANVVEEEEKTSLETPHPEDHLVKDSKDDSFLLSPIITDYRKPQRSESLLEVMDTDPAEERDAVYVGDKIGKDPLSGLDDFLREPPEETLPAEFERQTPSAEAAAGAITSAGGAKSTVLAESKNKRDSKEEKNNPAVRRVPYRLPALSLLTGGPAGSGTDRQKLKEDSMKLENVLASFGVKAQVVEVVCGPAVIRYELQPAPGVKVSKIVNLQDDIALALAAKGLRIEAPVPGKSVIGIEVAKPEITSVYFKDVVGSKRFQNSQSKLSVAFGIDINGNPVVGDLAAMPHLLIAGATGSGKSVCMNTLICSLLFKAKPDEVKIIMIDPKKVELTGYNGLPHLGRPVVTDPKKAALVLKEIVNEMDRRYTVFTACGVKNFKAYNNLPDVTKMSQIVVLIDELADLMMVASRDVENHIVRLTQLARAAGIHLVIATQRPSVDVITGLIKANIPSRIAFAVSSMVDSRTILDMGGAEKLLGKGDMLYHPVGLSRPIRVQGAFVSEEEIERLVEFCSRQAAQEFLDLPEESADSEEEKQESLFDDEYFVDACKLVMESGQASASYLQRRFRVGYNRAARLIEDMETLGVISPPDGKRRKVLMTKAEFIARYLNPSAEGDASADGLRE